MVKRKKCRFGCNHQYAPKASPNAVELHEKFCAQNPNKVGGADMPNEKDYDECVECGYEKVPTTSVFCPNCGVELDE